MRKGGIGSALLALALGAGLAGCGSPEPIWAPDEAVARARYVHDGPPRITLFTTIEVGGDVGAHSSIMVNSTERVIFDPAGTLKHPRIPERNDVLFGINPRVEALYLDFHARRTHYLAVQEIEVSPEMAARALALVKTYGAVAPARCAVSTSEVLGQLFPGQIDTTWYPQKLRRQFASVAGVRERLIHDDDSADKSQVLKTWRPDAPVVPAGAPAEAPAAGGTVFPEES